jgi:molybdenum cofactor guanylyltransferase
MTDHPASTPPLPLTAVLLAGGWSRRMGSDKALVELEGAPLWRRQLALLELMKPAELIVSGPRRPGFPAALRNLEDEGTSRGPLSGLATVLRSAASPHVLVLAIDMPLMTTAFLELLRERITAGRGVVPFHLEGVTREKFYEPLAAIYPRVGVDLAERHLAETDWSMQSFVRAGVSAGLLAEFEIPAEARKCFCNANRPGEAIDALG